MRALASGYVFGILVALAAAGPAVGMETKDPFFGEALFHAYQGRYFEALERLDTEIAQHYGVDERQLDSLYLQIDHAEFSVGDFELHYRMHHRAGRAIQAVLEADVEDEIRNEAAYRLARIHFHKGQPEDALEALDGIHGRIPDEIRNEILFLRANIYLALDRPVDAVEILEGLQGSEDLRGFASYNLGIALRKVAQGALQRGEVARAVAHLQEAREAFTEYTRLNATGPKVQDARRVIEQISTEVREFEASEPGMAT